jgi:hypothetical protein
MPVLSSVEYELLIFCDIRFLLLSDGARPESRAGLLPKKLLSEDVERGGFLTQEYF